MTEKDTIEYYAKENRELINSTPALFDILYDSDLLPECCTTALEALYMHTVCLAYRAGLAETKGEK